MVEILGPRETRILAYNSPWHTDNFPGMHSYIKILLKIMKTRKQGTRKIKEWRKQAKKGSKITITRMYNAVPSEKINQM